MPRKLISRSIASNAITSDKIAVGAVASPTPAVVSDQANTSTGYFDVPSGTTAQRPASPGVGMIRYNSDLGLLEQYNSAGWQAIDAPPTVSSYSGIINADTDSTITIVGTNFKPGCVAYIEGAGVNNTPRSLTTTFVSSTQITALTAASSSNYVGGASFNIKVINPSGLSGILTSAGTVDRDPVWSTGAGNIATINDRYGSYSPITTLSASDPDSTTVTYELASGSLPGNVSLNTTNGQITGDPNDVSGTTTYTFTINANSNTQSTPRTFNIIVNPTPDGTSSARAVSSPNAIRSLGITTNGTYWLNPDGGGAAQFYCLLDGTYGNYGWALAMKVNHPFWYGQYWRNHWDGHTGQTGPDISATNTWNGSYGTYLPNNASYVVYGFSNDGSNTLTDWVHASTVGDRSSNTGFYNRGAYNNTYFDTTTVQQNVTGMTSSGQSRFYFNDMDGTHYRPSGYGRGFDATSNRDSTNDLLGAIGDSCSQWTTNGITPPSDKSETYVGSRKNLDGSSGYGGAYCTTGSSSNGRWLMWWR